MSQRPGDVSTAILPQATTAPALAAGTRLAAFTIRKRIDEGGMGAVIYEAVQDSPQRLVALKVLPAAAGHAALERFAREADALARVQHRHVVAIYASGIVPEGDAFLAMELVPAARTLDAYVREKQCSLARRVELMIEVCSAVAEAHRLGLVHRDLKPGNILIGQAGEAKLIDFGITTAVNADGLGVALSPAASLPHGTPAYMSPEQARSSGGTIDARSDVYSLGAILFELLTAGPLRRFEPGDHASHGWIARVLETAPPLPSGSDPRLRGDADRLLLRALAFEPADRFANAGELAVALRALLADLAPPGQREPGPRSVTRLVRRSSRRFPLLTRVLCILLAAALGFFTLRRQIFNTLHFAALEPMLLHAAPAAPLDRMANVERVTFDDAFEGEPRSAAMRAFGIEGDPQSLTAIRALHARLIDRLVEAHARAIAFDLHFDGTSDGDTLLVAAVERAKQAGVPVLCVAPEWDGDLTNVPAFRPAFRFGGAAVGVGAGAWEMHLANEIEPGNCLASLSLASWLAARSPKTRWQYAIESPLTLRIQGFNPAPGVDAQGRPRETAGETLRLDATSAYGPLDSPATPARPRNLRLRVLIPSDAYLANSTFRYADVVAPAPDRTRLRSAFLGRIALIGDLRLHGEERHPYFDGRSLPAYDANAVGLETLATDSTDDALRVPPAALLGALLGIASLGVALASLPVLRRERPRRAIAIAAALLAIASVTVALSLVASAGGNLLINPGPPLLAGFAGFTLARLVAGGTRAPLT